MRGGGECPPIVRQAETWDTAPPPWGQRPNSDKSRRWKNIYTLFFR